MASDSGPAASATTDRNVEVNGIRMWVRERAGTKPACLLVHGFPLSHELWADTLRLLDAPNRLICPDLRGHGRSQATDQSSMRTYAEDLKLLLSALNVREPIVLAGLSMGGYIALEFARRYPSMIGAMVLVDTRAGKDSEEVRQGRFDLARRVLTEGSVVVADAMRAKLFSPKSPDSLAARWHAIMSATEPQGVAAALRAMADRSDSFDVLSSMAVVPALIVVGEDDVITPPTEADKMLRALPGAQMQVIPGAGHMTPVEQPGAFNGVLARFLRAL